MEPGPVEFVVEQVALYRIAGLRKRLLRPDAGPEPFTLPGDHDRETTHFAAYPVADPGSPPVGTVSVRREDAPWGMPAWRLRAMATEPAWRGQGVGTAMLAEVVTYLSTVGGGPLWCTARVAAQGLYARAGFVTSGEVWEEPGIGPHVVMWREI